MNYWKTLLPATATMLLAGQAVAQTDEEKVEIERKANAEREAAEQEDAESWKRSGSDEDEPA